MACSCGGGTRSQAQSWKHTSPNGKETVKRRKYEVEWLLRKEGGTIEPVDRKR